MPTEPKLGLGAPTVTSVSLSPHYLTHGLGIHVALQHDSSNFSSLSALQPKNNDPRLPALSLYSPSLRLMWKMMLCSPFLGNSSQTEQAPAGERPRPLWHAITQGSSHTAAAVAWGNLFPLVLLRNRTTPVSQPSSVCPHRHMAELTHRASVPSP